MKSFFSGVVIVIWIGLLIGWVKNIINLIGSYDMMTDVEKVLSLVGIVLLPVGAAAGYIL